METGWRKFTAQFGDITYGGAYQVVGDELQVVGDNGSRRARLSQADHVLNRAQELLIDINTPVAWPSESARADKTASAPTAPSAPAARPNNLVGAALLAVFLAAGAGLQFVPAAAGPLTFVFMLAGWILAVMAHEFGHALTAHLGGDHTVRAKGYLGFDPRLYGDLRTSLLFPLIALALGGIGFPGGAVYIRNDLIRSRSWRAATALAGPAATLLALLLLSAVLAVWFRVAEPSALSSALAMLAFLQATALILNLLPVPGLDGWGAIRPFLPAGVNHALRRYEGWAMMALLAALLLVPGVGGQLFGTAANLASGLGVPRGAIGAGWNAFHFWH